MGASVTISRLYNIFYIFAFYIIVCLIYIYTYSELRFDDASTSTMFVFDTLKKHLKTIQKGEETIAIEYSQKRPSTFKHSSGGRITVTYSDNGFVREARFEDGSGKKRRW